MARKEGRRRPRARFGIGRGLDAIGWIPFGLATVAVAGIVLLLTGDSVVFTLTSATVAGHSR